MKKQNVYLDYAAATPIDSVVLKAMRPYLGERFYNPSALYLAAKQTSSALHDARAIIASGLGAKPGEIIFTAGGTEANNLAIAGIMKQYPKAEVLVSAVEHESVLLTAKNFSARVVPVDAQGVVKLPELEALITDKTVLISVMLVNNEIGSIQPVKKIAQLIKQLRAERQKKGSKLPLILHSDACQATNYFDLHVHRLGVDMMSINGSKIYGPKQIGALFVRAGLVLQPLVYGGGQEQGLRSGTENVSGAVGLAAAFELTQQQRAAEVMRIIGLRDLFISLITSKNNNVLLNGPKNHRSPNNVNLTFPGLDNERLLMELDEAGIECATGSACSASSEQPSHVLMAIGLSEDKAKSSLRFSLGRQTTKADVLYAAEVLNKLTTVSKR